MTHEDRRGEVEEQMRVTQDFRRNDDAASTVGAGLRVSLALRIKLVHSAGCNKRQRSAHGETFALNHRRVGYS